MFDFSIKLTLLVYLHFMGITSMQVSDEKYNVPHLDKKGQMHRYKKSGTRLGSTTCEKDLGILVDYGLSMSQQYLKLPKGQISLGLHQQRYGVKINKRHSSILYCTAQSTPGILCSVLIATLQGY